MDLVVFYVYVAFDKIILTLISGKHNMMNIDNILINIAIFRSSHRDVFENICPFFPGATFL